MGIILKKEQLSRFFAFLTDTIGLDPNKLYVSCFIGDEQAGINKDEESANIWQKLFASKKIEAGVVEIGSEENGAKFGMQGGRIFYYDASKNWWSRSGTPVEMPSGEPGGPDSEVFYEFEQVEHDLKFGEHCHPNCDCGRYLEIGNSVFMEFIKKEDGSFGELPAKNVDFGGGLERIAAASLNEPDVFKISLIWPVIEKLQALSSKPYEDNSLSMRVIADHLRAATFLAVDGVIPSNKGQGYVMRRLMRRAIRYAFDIGIEQGLCESLSPVIAGIYRDDFPEVLSHEQEIINILVREEKVFRQTLRSGLVKLQKISKDKSELSGSDIFLLYDTYGFPYELAVEEAQNQDIKLNESWKDSFDKAMEEQRERSRTATKGEFKGGLADTGEMTTKLHTAAHLLDAALHQVLGDSVVQRGSNINAERLRFDFSHPEKVNPEQIAKIEQIVNDAIKSDLPVTWKEENTDDALKSGAIGAFGHKYGEKVKVYTIGDQNNPFSREICGGPHVEHTGQLSEDNKKFVITKEEASSAGVRRIKASLL